MQTKILYSLVALCLSATAVAQSASYAAANVSLPVKETSFKVSVIPDDNTAAFKLYVFNPGQKKIDLQIIHPVNGVLIDTSFSDEQYNRRYNFEMAEDGQYQFKLVSGKERVTKKVGINTVTTRNIIVID